MQALTHEYLLTQINYDPEAGVFTWKQPRRGRQIGKPVGCSHVKGYLTVTIDNVRYLLHRLAWFYVHGVWPDGELDHRDLDRKNNRIDNLRLASSIQNKANTGLRSTNKSGFKGVHWYRKTNAFRAVIRVNGKPQHLGYFGTAEEAGEAYRVAASSVHGEFARAV